MTVGELQDRLTYEEYTDWVGLYSLERSERQAAELARESDAAMARMKTKNFGRQ